MMKRILSMFLILLMLLTATGCSGSYARVDLKETISIPDNGIIEKNLLDKIKKENAIAVFSGESSGLTYEWTIFGSDIEHTRDTNFLVQLEEIEKGVRVVTLEKEEIGFPALLSIYMKEKWDSESATAYEKEEPIFSVSITGSENSILNIPVNRLVSEYVISPDQKSEEIEQPEKIDATEKPSPIGEDFVASDSQEEQEQSSSSQDTVFVEEYQENENQSDNHQESASADDYLSAVSDSGGRVYSDGQSTEQDQYKTDPVPIGKPLPVEPENQKVDSSKTYTATISIECSTILNNLSDLDPDKLELVPSDGVILPPTRVSFSEGESVFDALQRVCKENNIHMESSWTPIYNSAYIEGIHNLYEFDCGSLSGWMYRVDGWYPNYGCSRYVLQDGENIEWRYTCDLGKDVGCDWMQ